MRWVRRCLRDCQRRGVPVERLLNRRGAGRWGKRFAAVQGSDSRWAQHAVQCALRAWSWGLAACGYVVPQWEAPTRGPPRLPPLLDAFVRYQLETRGVSQASTRRDLNVLLNFLRFLRRCGRTPRRLKVADLDRFMYRWYGCVAKRTAARIACTLRCFLRFLYATGRLRYDLAGTVATPRIHRSESPPRALPWNDVRRILKAIHRKTRTGRRDYALLLLMATYGLGAGEVRRLTLDDVDWRRQQVRIVRPKTGREFFLPLLPAVARALVAYLRLGRPRHCTSRVIFVRAHAPYGGFGSAGAIRHVLQKHASAAGVTAEFLGSHVLRHSHASRQIDLGASPAIVGDILGHRRTETTSTYVRVALRRLRGMSLPVPR